MVTFSLFSAFSNFDAIPCFPSFSNVEYVANFCPSLMFSPYLILISANVFKYK